MVCRCFSSASFRASDIIQFSITPHYFRATPNFLSSSPNLLFRYAADLFRWIRPKRLEVSGTLGFDDPLITGYMYAAQAWLNSSGLRWHSDLNLLFDEVVPYELHRIRFWLFAMATLN